MKTVKVRLPVAVDSEGVWCGYGAKTQTDKDTSSFVISQVGPVYQLQWITAELPIPSIPEVAGEVEEVKHV